MGRSAQFSATDNRVCCIVETNQMREQAGQMAEQFKQTAQDWSEKAKGTARDAGAAADLYLHEYAWTTVAVVGVAALLVGYLLGRNQS